MNRKSRVDRYELYVGDFVCNKFGFADYNKLCLNPKKVLDVGCGVGPFSIYFADKKVNVDAIDINPIAVELCEKNSQLYNLHKFINVINEDFSKYKMVIHCGGCMLNEREMKYRIKTAVDNGIPITNYGTAIAHMNGILKRSLMPFPEAVKELEE